MKQNLFQRQCAQTTKHHQRGIMRFFGGAAAGFSIVTLLLMSTPASAQTVQDSDSPTASSDAISTLELSCVPQGDKFLCEAIDESAIAPSETNSESPKTAITTDTQPDLEDIKRVRVSNLVLTLAVILFGAVALNVMVHRKRSLGHAEQQLERQIELLERIWHRSSSV